MSEFQYYEFRAIDRPLAEREMAEVRKTSTRAEITPTRFVNVYHFGDYHGNPVKLMQKYYDVHVYYANWGTVRWMVRVPADLVPLDEVRPYELEGVLEISKSGKHLVLQFLREADDGDYLEEEDTSHWADRVEEIREQILSGDYRALYLMWLSGVSQEYMEIDEEEQEPPVPQELAKLDRALKKLCQVFEVDRGLIKAAAKTSGKQQAPADKSLERWIAQLPAAEKNRLLVEVCSGHAKKVSAELIGEFRRAQPKQQPGGTRRTVKELRKHLEGRVDEGERLEDYD